MSDAETKYLNNLHEHHKTLRRWISDAAEVRSSDPDAFANGAEWCIANIDSSPMALEFLKKVGCESIKLEAEYFQKKVAKQEARIQRLREALESAKRHISGCRHMNFPINVRELDGTVKSVTERSMEGKAFDILEKALATDLEGGKDE